MNANWNSGIDQAELRFLVEKNVDGIVVIDESGIVRFANPASEQIFGRPRASLIGSPLGILLVSGETTEITIHRPGGGLVDVEIRAVDTVWANRVACLATIRDVSARKAIEERLRHSTKMEAVGRLTAGIAHDFNNLLTVVLGNLELAQRHPAGGPTLARALGNAVHGARRAAALTERLLAFARKKPLEPKVMNINELVFAMSDLLRRTLGESIVISTSLAADLWNVEVDPAELESAIVNLAVNARDAMMEGGRVSIETANVEFDPHYAADAEMSAGSYVLISVSDTGTGMTPEVLSQVFEPFFTTKTDGRGTGLGLSQIYGFVKQSGGHIKLYSEPNIGTSVKIYLPRAAVNLASVEAEAVRPDPPAPRAHPGETVLVVEDDDDVRSCSVSSLRELGYSVLESPDAASALRIIEGEPGIDLLFTDLGLPGDIDGAALAALAQRRREGLKVLITTAYAGTSLIHDGRLNPGVELIPKPFSFSVLGNRVRTILDRDRKHKARSSPILVVDDEALLRMFTIDILTEQGYRAEEAASFKDAMDKLGPDGAARFAAAIIDVGLPDRPGNELARELRAQRPELPIVFATGLADDAVREAFVNDEHAAVLAKPFDGARLLATLRMLGVDQRRSD